MNEWYTAVESCVERERYEMIVEWIEVWALYAARYTRFILVCFVSRNEAPNSCSGYVFAPIPQFGRVCNLPVTTNFPRCLGMLSRGGQSHIVEDQRTTFFCGAFPKDGQNQVS